MSQSIWQKHPELSEELLRLVRESDVDSLDTLLGQLNGWATSNGIDATIDKKSVKAKLAYEGRTQDDVRAFLDRFVATASEAQKDAWSVVGGLENRLSELIQSGALNEHSVDDLYKQLRDEFTDELEKHDARLTRAMFRSRVQDLVWTKERLQALREIVRHDLPLTAFTRHNPHVPEGMVQHKVRELSGTSQVLKHPATFSGGVNRISPLDRRDDDDDFRLPSGTVEDPYVVDLDVENFSMRFINGANIGLAHSRLIQENIPRCALEEAECRGDDAVFITGGMIHMDLTQASSSALKTYRAVLSGYNTNVDVLDPDYQDRARRVRDGEESSTDLVYETVAERFLNLVAGWAKIGTRSSGEPEFSGKILIQLGYNEEELIKTVASWEVRYWTIVRHYALRAERKAAEQARDESIAHLGELLESGMPKRDDYDSVEDYEDAVEQFEERVDRYKDEVEKRKREAARLLSEEKRTLVSNISDEDRKRVYRRALAFVVEKIEKAIPNSTVIASGTTAVKIGDEVIELRQPHSRRVSDGVLHRYLKKRSGGLTLRGTPPDAVVLCHPYGINYRWAVVERAEGGDRYSTDVFHLPVAMDRDFLEEQFAEHSRIVLNAQRMLDYDQCEMGVLRLSYVDGAWVSDVTSSRALVERSRQRREGPKSKRYSYALPPYIYLLVNTDNHVGHPWKDFHWDPVNERWIGDGPALIEMMRRDGLLDPDGDRTFPLHSVSYLDDMTQGHHFATEKQPHQNVYTYAEFEERLQQLQEEGATDELMREALWQFRLRGEHWTQDQLMEFVSRMIEPNLDFYSAILRRNQESGVEFRGASQYLGTLKDTRDIGAINFGTGNHFNKTVDDELTEGTIFATILRMRLRALSEWGGKSDLLDRLVRSPLYGNIHIGWGTVGVPGGYEWGLSLRNAPAKKSSSGDPLRRATKNIIERGNFSRFFEDRTVLHLSGDIHRYGGVWTPYGYVVSCASATDTDPYGERGFSPNNTGVLVVGLPADGPESGPVRLVSIRHEFVRDYFKDPRSIDWEELFPNPA